MSLKMIFKGKSSLVVAALAFLASIPAFAEQQTFSTALTVNQGSETIVLNLEVAACARQRSRGLQGRTSLADDAGMLFLIEPADKVSMWMKDTYIPLDILFVDADDRVVGLVESATPMSLRSINSPKAVAAVVEVNAGFIRRSGIQIGHRVDYQLPADMFERHCGVIG